MTPDDRSKKHTDKLEALTKKIDLELASRAQDGESIRTLEDKAVMRARKLGLEGERAIRKHRRNANPRQAD